MDKKILTVVLAVLLIIAMVPAPAFSAAISLNLSKYAAQPGDSITASGTADPIAWVSIKILDSSQGIVFYDAVKSDAKGNYSGTFIVPYNFTGTLTVIAGYGSNVAGRTLAITAKPSTDKTAPTWSGGKLTASSISQTGLVLTWSGAFDNVGVTGYKVYKGNTLLTIRVIGTTYAVTGLSPNTDYTFSVQAGDAAGNWSTEGPVLNVSTGTLKLGDMNSDNAINILDLSWMYQFMGPVTSNDSCKADVNQDGIVGIRDLLIVAQHIGS